MDRKRYCDWNKFNIWIIWVQNKEQLCVQQFYCMICYMKMITTHSYKSTQQITNVIKYGVATGVTTTYDTTNTPNKLLTHPFIRIVSFNKTTGTSLFSVVLLYIQLPLVLCPNNPNITFIPITIPFPTPSCF